MADLRRDAGLVLEVLADPRRLLGDAVSVDPVDLVLDGQLLRFLVFVSWNQNRKLLQPRAQRSKVTSDRGKKKMAPTNFPEALVLVDATVESDGGVSRLLQQAVGRVGGLRVLLDGLQEERVASDPLHRHHQEEAQRCGVDLGPAEQTPASDLHPPQQAQQQRELRTRTL